jgi:hypothetical protein
MRAGQAESPGAPTEVRGWRLTVVAWQMMRRDPTMIALALIGAGCGIAGAAAMLYFGGYFSGDAHSRSHFAVVALIALYPLTFISVFFNVAFAAAAQANFNGRTISVGEALEAAWQRLDKIALWSLLSAGVGLVLSEIAARIPGGGRLTSWLLGAAWGVATIFAIPLLAIEDAGPVEALRGSGHLIKSRWGEGISGLVGIGAWATIVAIPAGILLAIGLGVSTRHPETGIPLITIGLGALVVVSALATATRQVFAVALYRYATDVPTGGFSAADLEYPFAPRKKKGRRTHWIAWVALALIAALVLAAAIFGRHDPLTDTHGHAHVYFEATPKAVAAVRNGMPVFYGRERVGSVIYHRIEGSEEYVRFYIEPQFRDLSGSPGVELNYRRPNHPYLLLWDNGKN